MSSHMLHLIFQSLFPVNDYRWLNPEMFMTNGALCGRLSYPWITLFVVDHHWVIVLKVLADKHVYRILAPHRSNIKQAIQRLSDILGIPIGLIRTFGEFFPTTHPGLCGPAAVLTILKHMRLRYFSKALTPYTPICHRDDFSFSNLYLIRQHSLNLELAVPSERELLGFPDTRAGGNMGTIDQEAIQHEQLQRNIFLYLSPLTEELYLTNADIQHLIPHYLRYYDNCHFYITPHVEETSLLLPTSHPAMIFQVYQHRWQVIVYDAEDLICITNGSPDSLQHFERITNYSNLRKSCITLRSNTLGWDGYALCSFLLYGQQSLTNTICLYQSVLANRLQFASPYSFRAGFLDTLSKNYTPLPPLSYEYWYTNHQLDIVGFVTTLDTICRYLPSCHLPYFSPPTRRFTWGTIVCHLQHWIPLYYDSTNHRLHTFANQLPQNFLFRIYKLLQYPTINLHNPPDIANGWCGHLSILILQAWVHHQPPQYAMLSPLFHLQQLLPTPYSTSFAAGMIQHNTTTAPQVHPTDLDVESTHPTCPPTATWQTSVPFSTFSLTPQFIDSCDLPDLTKYGHWDPLETSLYNMELTEAFAKLPFTHTRHTNLGLIETLKSRIDDFLHPEHAHFLENLIHQATFQTFCPHKSPTLLSGSSAPLYRNCPLGILRHY